MKKTFRETFGRNPRDPWSPKAGIPDDMSEQEGIQAQVTPDNRAQVCNDNTPKVSLATKSAKSPVIKQPAPAIRKEESEVRTAESLAKKHGVSVEEIEKQLQMGQKIEHEHTDSDKVALKIAMDHVEEFPDYYTRLTKMEKEAKKDLNEWYQVSDKNNYKLVHSTKYEGSAHREAKKHKEKGGAPVIHKMSVDPKNLGRTIKTEVPMKEEVITEGKMKEIASHPAFERLKKHIETYKQRKMSPDALGAHSVNAGKKIAKDLGHEHKHVQAVVNRYVDGELKEEFAQLDELDLNTTKSYIAKAKYQRDRLVRRKEYENEPGSKFKTEPGEAKTIQKRTSGLNRALKRTVDHSKKQHDASPNKGPDYGYGRGRYMGDSVEVDKTADTLQEGMPLKGHPYHTKSDAELHYIIKDAGAAAKAMKGHSPSSESKYLDQVNDASTVLHHRKNGGKQLTKEDADNIPPIHVRSLYTKTYAKHGGTAAKTKEAQEKAYAEVEKKHGKDMRSALQSYHQKNMSEETLNELSPTTLASYKKKAGQQASDLDVKAGKYASLGNREASKAYTEKSNQRFRGIIKATKKELKVEDSADLKKAYSKSARIIKSIYKKNRMVKEDLYDHEKGDKDPARVYGKAPKMQRIEDKGTPLGKAPKAGAVLSGGTTMTGKPRDTILVDPQMKLKKPGQGQTEFTNPSKKTPNN